MLFLIFCVLVCGEVRGFFLGKVKLRMMVVRLVEVIGESKIFLSYEGNLERVFGIIIILIVIFSVYVVIKLLCLLSV